MAQLTLEEIAQLCKQDIDAARQVAEIESTQNEKMYQYYRGKTMGNEVDGKSKIVSTDVFETVEWLLPAVMDIFSPENGFPVLEPVGPEDVDPAEAMTELIQYQFWRQNDGEVILRQAIKDCMLYRPGGIIKYSWEKVVGMMKKSWVGVPEYAIPHMTPENGYQISQMTPTDTGFDVTGYKKDLEYDGPRFDVLPPWEFLRHPNAKNVKDSPFCAHKKLCTVDYLKKLGAQRTYDDKPYFTGVDKAVREAIKPPSDDVLESRIYNTDSLSKDEEPSKDPSRQEVILYEIYGKYDTDGDGILESKKIYMVGSTILRMDDNPYGCPPFICLRDIEDTHKFSGIPIAELVEDLQRFRTFLIRQMADNMAQQNNATLVFDPTKVNQADIFNNLPGRNIRVKAGVRPADAVVPLPMVPFSAVTFNVLEYATLLTEQRTGVTKSFKAVGDSNNQTATGQLTAINQASMRVRLIAKVLASSLADLFRAMVSMNKQFLTQNVWIRLFENKFVEIRPDDLEGRMDMSLNIVMGAAGRQQQIMNLQQLLSIFGQLVPVGIPALDAKNTAEITREIIKNMGYKNQDRFLPQIFLQPPDQANQAMQQQQMQQAMLDQGGGGGAGGANVSSMGSLGTGDAATTNPSGGGSTIAAIQSGAGGMVPGLGV